MGNCCVVREVMIVRLADIPTEQLGDPMVLSDRINDALRANPDFGYLSGAETVIGGGQQFIVIGRYKSVHG